MHIAPDGLDRARHKMREAGAHTEAIDAFADAYQRVADGEATLVASADLEPATEVTALDALPASGTEEALAQTAVIKLNGGLATSMGLSGPKSLVQALEGQSFLAVILAQLVALRERYDARLPLVLMNSDATDTATKEALLDDHHSSGAGVATFLQSMIPKLRAQDMSPVDYTPNPALEWCPPGHGDVYGALRRSGMLERLLADGFRVAMISNSDNLGAYVDPRIPAHVLANRIPFLMEVVQGTEADRKGGHIARRREDGRLILRETAQTPDDDLDSFRDYRRWRYYNTNSLWVDLEALHDLLERTGGFIRLPVILNRKTVDPRDSGTTAVLQLESAMGAAIGAFEGAQLLQVPRTRFAPVKTTDDLLVLRSDVYRITPDRRVEPLPERADNLPYVELDSAYYKLIDQFEQRFPAGPPSLKEAERLIVKGDVTFGEGVVVRGRAEINADGPRTIANETIGS